jgi:hypothetical protein
MYGWAASHFHLPPPERREVQGATALAGVYWYYAQALWPECVILQLQAKKITT